MTSTEPNRSSQEDMLWLLPPVSSSRVRKKQEVGEKGGRMGRERERGRDREQSGQPEKRIGRGERKNTYTFACQRERRPFNRSMHRSSCERRCFRLTRLPQPHL